ncbi:LacI family transcriptional regulator [Plantibacter flavus]|uniref:LacI family DNA-binding transcriptional regulator n=1 Tax=Plantibacter flavus TaxID=150123 RepID=UPI0010C1C8DA|nr:LacI family transcriptional regulator [Plantibacter flavus]
MMQSGQGAPTLEMVAARAGVSRATVSRVVNGSPKVTAEVVAVVNEAIAALDYVPNRAARSLASRRTQVIALVVPESTARVFSDPFFASVVQGVALELAQTDYTLNLLIATEANSEKTRRYLLGGNVDGALVVSHHSGDHSYTRLGQELPIVFGGRPMGADVVDSTYVDVDNVEGARTAARHLIEAGRTRIATIAGRQDMPGGVDRLAGWRAELELAGLPHDLVEVGDFSPADGAAAMRRLLARGVPIDGLFAANDQMAAGAYSVIREAGLTIPGDIAVVGYDDDRYGETAAPPLTTIAQSPVDLGAEMARVLVRRLAGEPVERVTMMPTRLVPRASV